MAQEELAPNPFVQLIVPRDRRINAPVGTHIFLYFTHSMDPDTITVNTQNTSPFGSVQVSNDNFVTTVQMLSAPRFTNKRKEFELVPKANLVSGTEYKVKFTNKIMSTDGLTVNPQYGITEVTDGVSNSTTYVQPTGFTTNYPSVVDLIPDILANNVTDVLLDSTISVIFDRKMNVDTITTNRSNSDVSGTILVSHNSQFDVAGSIVQMKDHPASNGIDISGSTDRFLSEEGTYANFRILLEDGTTTSDNDSTVGSFLLETSDSSVDPGDNTSFILTPIANLASNTTYYIKITDGIEAFDGGNTVSNNFIAYGFTTGNSQTLNFQSPPANTNGNFVTYTLGERVIGQNSGSKGNVVTIPSNTVITINSISGTFQNEEEVKGDISGAIATLRQAPYATFAPTVVGTSLEGAGDVLPGSNISVLFSQSMNISTVNTSTSAITTAHSILVSRANAFTMTFSTAPGGAFTIHEKITGSVSEATGRVIDEPSTTTLRYEALTGVFVPGETVTGASSTQTGVVADSVLESADFESNLIVAMSSTTPTSELGNSIFTMVPAADLIENVFYKVKVKNSAQDIGQANIKSEFISDGFTVQSNTTFPEIAHILIGSDQSGTKVVANGATGVPLNTGTAKLSVSFTKPMNVHTISCANSTAPNGTIQVSMDDFNSLVEFADSSPVASNSNQTYTLTPASNLASANTYKVRVGSGVTDNTSSENNLGTINNNVLANTTSTGFVTETSTPTVITIEMYNSSDAKKDIKAGAQTAIKIDSNIIVTFSQEMNVETMNVVFTHESHDPSGSILLSYDGTNYSNSEAFDISTGVSDSTNFSVVTLKPKEKLGGNTNVYVRMTTGIEDKGGTAIAQTNAHASGGRTDTTAPTVSNVAVMIEGTAGFTHLRTNGTNSNKTGVANTTAIIVTFDQAMSPATLTANTGGTANSSTSLYLSTAADFGSVVQTFATGAVNRLRVSADGRQVTLVPSANLAASTTHYVGIGVTAKSLGLQPVASFVTIGQFDTT